MALPKPEESKSAEYIKLADGANRIRIVSEPIEVYEHFAVGDDGKKHPVICLGNQCRICAMDRGNRPKKQYHFAAINRNEQLKTGTAAVKLLSVGRTVYEQYYDLSVSEDWKFDSVPGYDIIVNRSGAGMETTYTVQPVMPKPLTPADASIVENGKKVNQLVKERYGSAPSASPSCAAPSSAAKDEIRVEDIPF